MAYVFCRAVNSLLVNKVQVTQGRLLVSEPLKQDTFGHELKAAATVLSRETRMSPDPYIANSRSLSCNRPIYEPVRCLGLKARLNLRNRFHEREVQSQYVCYPLDLFDWRPRRVAL